MVKISLGKTVKYFFITYCFFGLLFFFKFTRNIYDRNNKTFEYAKFLFRFHHLLQNGPKQLTWPFYLKPNPKSVLRDFDLTFYNEEEKSFLEIHLPKMIERAENVGIFCTSNKQNGTQRPWDNFIWYKRLSHKLIYFPTFKVGSTTMKSYFLYADNYWSDDPEFLKMPLSQREKNRFSSKYGWTQVNANNLFKMPESLEERIVFFRESLRIIIVRHPFARILSSYLFRMSRSRKDEDERYDVIRNHIIKTYRTKNDDEALSKFPTFPEFVKFLIDNENLIQEDRLDKFNNLFMLQSRITDSCLIDPNIVIKLETFDEDIRFLGFLTNIKEWKTTVKFPKRISHPTSSTNPSNFFKLLSNDEINSLYRIYKRDFEMFGYTVEEYLGEDF